METKRARNNEIRLHELHRQRESLIMLLEKGLAELENLRAAIMDMRNSIMERERRIDQLAA
jgi:hypothetical protein